jgi:hypothetical protein
VRRDERRLARSWLAAALTGAALAGCTPMQWVDMRTGSTEGSDTALADCRNKARDEAWRSSWLASWPPAFYQPYPRYPGWGRPFWINRPLNDDLYLRLTDFCMRSKGYRLVDAPQPGGS